MTPALALLVVALLVSVGIVVYAFARYGQTYGAGAVAGLAALWAAAWGLWQTLRPMPARPGKPRHPDAPLPEADRERKAVEVHEAHVEEMAKVLAIEDGEVRRKELAKIAAGKWKRGPDSTGGEGA